jgi:AcrR family transcriptional regulator
MPQEDDPRRQERAQRILDAAAELIQRWGYKKTAIDDIARQAQVAKGTIYLHWKTREDLFLALLMREQKKGRRAVEQAMTSDPEGMTLHGLMKHATLMVLHNPLLRALMMQDSEMLGELVHSEFGRSDVARRMASIRVYLELQRSKGLLRTDLSVDEQLSMLMAISTGFLLVNQFLPDDYQLSLETSSVMLSDTIRRTFEVRDPTPEEQQEILHAFHQMTDTVREQRQRQIGIDLYQQEDEHGD